MVDRQVAITCDPPSRPCELPHVSTCAALTAGLMSGKVLQPPGIVIKEPACRNLNRGKSGRLLCSNGLCCHRWHGMQRHQDLGQNAVGAPNPAGRSSSLAGWSSKRKLGMSRVVRDSRSKLAIGSSSRCRFPAPRIANQRHRHHLLPKRDLSHLVRTARGWRSRMRRW